MLWLEPVIGTAPWCWWQVPARRYQRRVGVLRARLTVGTRVVRNAATDPFWCAAVAIVTWDEPARVALC